jgi:hypothetical protein
MSKSIVTDFNLKALYGVREIVSANQPTMSSTRAASLAALAATVKFDGYLDGLYDATDRLYDTNMKEAESPFHLLVSPQIFFIYKPKRRNNIGENDGFRPVA